MRCWLGCGLRVVDGFDLRWRVVGFIGDLVDSMLLMIFWVVHSWISILDWDLGVCGCLCCFFGGLDYFWIGCGVVSWAVWGFL